MKQNNTGYTFCLFHRDLYFNCVLSQDFTDKDDEERHIVNGYFYFAKNLTHWQYRWLTKLENNETCYLCKSKKGAE